MFLNFIKNFLLKRKLKNSIVKQNIDFSKDKIISVGLIIDENVFFNKLELIKELVKNDIELNNIKILIYRNKTKKAETQNEPVFTMKSVNWQGDFVGKEVKDFVSGKYDLLINYFEDAKTPLILTSMKTQANFRVGFSSTDKQLNDFIIDTTIDKYEIFVTELFKYLKILNKI